MQRKTYYLQHQIQTEQMKSHRILGRMEKNNPKTDLPEVELHDATVVRPLSTAPAFSSQNQPLITILRSRFVTNKTAPRRPLVLPVLLTHSPPLGHRPLPRCALVTVRIPLLCDGSDGVDPSGVEHPRSGHRSAVLAFNFTNSHSLFAIPISQNRAHSFRSSSSVIIYFKKENSEKKRNGIAEMNWDQIRLGSLGSNQKPGDDSRVRMLAIKPEGDLFEVGTRWMTSLIASSCWRKAMTLILCGLFVLSSCENWAVLVAGSNEWSNYRHQSDCFRNWQILKKNNFKMENVITMCYDDIAHNPRNPFPGQMFNYPNGPNVYIGTENIDYTGRDVTAEKFYAVLKGDRAKAGGKVLETTENDNIFIHYNDHDTSGLLLFPTGGCAYAKDLNAVLDYMTAHKRYKRILFYIEACYSGTMFDKILKNNTNIYAVTAANTQESSYAVFCGIPKYGGTCLSNEFSQHWMNISEAVDLKSYSVQRQFETARSQTTGSHVMEYGDRSLKSLPLSEFQAGTDEKSFLPPDLQEYVDLMKPSSDLGISVPQPEAHIFSLQSMAENDPFSPVAQEYHEQYQLKLAESRRSDTLAASFQMTVQDALSRSVSPDDSDLYRWAIETYEEKCGRLNEFSLWSNTAVLAQAVQDGKLNDAKSRRQYVALLKRIC
ncbi:putative Vacuolar-processing enzyme beta-isozyme [Blattamonas nauphoetae]|uniref:Vacuolar-processing enzyme beta-isozyme n=1 Tax=Blattamonas nauphoetae TaxID=2049346 RepID=A0ABQ9X9E7_9EUKA|nr:putative Vacuolar-processing enzyme beta-isozyme [Blattamonas nauphoetae]